MPTLQVKSPTEAHQGREAVFCDSSPSYVVVNKKNQTTGVDSLSDWGNPTDGPGKSATTEIQQE